MQFNDQEAMAALRFDTGNLYREESYSDLQAGSIKVLTPVKADGSPDSTRPPLYVGVAQIMSAAGPLPIQCPIEAATLTEAMERFPAAVKEGVDRLIEEAKKIRLEEASRIVVPGQETIPKILR
jgi:hypothetical protein